MLWKNGSKVIEEFAENSEQNWSHIYEPENLDILNEIFMRFTEFAEFYFAHNLDLDSLTSEFWLY